MKKLRKMMALVIVAVMVFMYSVPATFALTAADVTEPTAKTLTASGSEQALVNAGSAPGYTIQYKLGENDWSTDIPKAKDKGTYNVQWRVYDTTSETVVNDTETTNALSGSVTATIADPSYDMPLTVTGLAEGDTVKFYKVIEWVGESDDANVVSGWKAISPYDTVLTKDKLIEVLVGTKADNTKTPPVAAKDPTGITSELAGELAKKAASDGVDPSSQTADTATLENPGAGLWMALVTPKDANTIYNPVFVAADYNKDQAGTVAMTGNYNGDAVAKKSTLTLTKTAATTEDTWDDGKSNTTAIGDTVTFTVTTAIPAYGDVYDNPHFVLTDKLTAMELKADAENTTGYDIQVNGVPAKYIDADDEEQDSYTIAPAADKKSYTITFTEGYLKSLKSAVSPVTVVYKAVVTTDGAKAINEEDNEVSIEYSHNPNQQNDYDVKKDTTQHYTFSLDAEGAGEGQTVSGKKTSELVKIGVDAKGDPVVERTETSQITDTESWSGPLQGAVFGLFTDENGTVPYKDKDGSDVTATTGGDGRMNFTGLDAGTYYLKEISAPAGYVTDTQVRTVVIAAEFDTVKVTEWWTGSEWVSTKPNSGTAKEVTYDTEILKKYTVTINNVPTATYTFTNEATASSTDIQWETATLVEKPYEFMNVKGTELPSTGGIGTTIFYVVGALLVFGAGVLLVTRRRARASEQ